MILLSKNKKYLSEDQINNYMVCQKVCRELIEKYKIDISVNGIENIPTEGPTLIASNHQNFFDIVLLASIIDRPMPFASAKELLKYPILNKYIEAIGCVLIDRDTTNISIVKKQLNEMEKIINEKGLVLFPEGECSYKDDEVKEFKKGGFVSVSKNECSIVPTYIKYGNLKSIGKWYIPTSSVSVTFGNSFTCKDISDRKVKPQELAVETRNRVLSLKM